MTVEFSCRGIERRDEIVKNYNLSIVSYTKLLNGQEKPSCAGQRITDKYYTFKYAHKINAADEGVFICGVPTGQEFIAKANLKPVPLFNPLTSLLTIEEQPAAVVNGPQDQSGTGTAKGPHKQTVEIPKSGLEGELYIAINLIVICWNTPLYGGLAKIQEKSLKYQSVFSIKKDVEFVNNILGKDYYKRTLVQIVEKLRTNNPELNEYSFPLINDYLKSIEKISNFG